MSHTDHHLFTAGCTRALYQRAHDDNQTFTAFEGKSFLTYIAGVKVTLHAFGSGKSFKNPALRFGTEIRLGPVTFDPLLQPLLLSRVVDVHVLVADRAAIDFLQVSNDVPQFGSIDAVQGRGLEFCRQIGLSQSTFVQLHFPNLKLLHQVERINVGQLMATRAIGIDQCAHLNLFSVVFG